MQENFNLIEAFLSQKIGIKPKILGTRKIAKAIETRLSICGVSDANTYLKLLQTSPQEFAELVELLIVPETWFFRDRQAFDFAIHFIRTEWLSQPHRSRLKLLSAPCSTGEEPYSLAMALLDIGCVPAQFQIDAIDISKNSLEKAKKGIYTRNSFRGDNLDFQQRYFTQIERQYHLAEKIKQTVNFSQGNLASPHFLLDQQNYDIIFCRNVLIYFDTAAREQTIKTFQRLLKNQGLLFVAASETGLLTEFGFELIRSPLGLAGRKKNPPQNLKLAQTAQTTLKENPQHSKHQTHNKTTQTITTKPARQPDESFDKVKTPDSSRFLPPTEQKAKEQQNYNLETIRHLADQGNLKEAASRCENYLKQHSTSAEAYVLLGEIYQAQKLENQAEQNFQKAIYLDPKNYQALLHLALLKEHQGEITKAKLLRQRLQRLKTF